MIKYALKYHIMTVVPLQECVYFYTKLPSATKLSNDLLLLNYQSRSPFPKSDLFKYVYRKVHLSVWFTRPKAYSALFVVPEGFWIYHLFQEQGDGLYIVELSDHKKLIMHIEKGVLLSQYILPSSAKADLLEKQYGISATHVSYHACETSMKALYNDPAQIQYLRHFLNFDLSKEKIITYFNDKLYYPLVLVIVFYMLISLYQSYSMESKIVQLTKTYKSLRAENSKLQEAVLQHNEMVERLETFEKEELQHQDPMKILYALKEIIHKGEDAKITYISMVDDRMELRLDTQKSAMTYFKRLDALGFFKDIIIENTYKKKDGIKSYVYVLLLKVSH